MHACYIRNVLQSPIPKALKIVIPSHIGCLHYANHALSYSFTNLYAFDPAKSTKSSSILHFLTGHATNIIFPCRPKRYRKQNPAKLKLRIGKNIFQTLHARNVHNKYYTQTKTHMDE